MRWKPTQLWGQMISCCRGATLGHPPLLDHIRLAAGNGFAGVSIRTADYLQALAEGSTAEQLRATIDDAGLLAADIDCIVPILGRGKPGGEFYGAAEDDVLRCAEALEARCWCIWNPYLSCR